MQARSDGRASEEPGPILIVDDDPGIRQTLQWALEDEGYLVSTARDGRDGLHQALRQKPVLVILDAAMPVLDGQGFAAELRRHYQRSVPIVLITADGRAAEKARRVGAFGYVQKPFDIDNFIALVRQGLAMGDE